MTLAVRQKAATERIAKMTDRELVETPAIGADIAIGDYIKAVFHRHPELVGFSIEDPSKSSRNAQSTPAYQGLIIQIEVLWTISIARYVDIHESVRTDIEEFMTARPGMFELLRGRTFARTLH